MCIRDSHDGTILFEVEAVELVLKVRAVLGSDSLDEIDVFVRVEGGEVLLTGIVVVQL